VINSSRPIASTHSPVGSACGAIIMSRETKTKASSFFSFWVLISKNLIMTSKATVRQNAEGPSSGSSSLPRKKKKEAMMFH
jgi:hypothetical protein